MSRIVYNSDQRPRWTGDTPIFLIARENYDPVATRQNTPFGASCASAVLGPDLKMPAGEGTNYPSIGGPPWDALLRNGPNQTFVGDRQFAWIRGHLINGRWHAPGDTWRNLTPLTGVANPNHATLEGYIDNYLLACHRYEDDTHRDYWYGVYYCVQTSADPFSDASTTGPTNLYSYAPEFIRVTWRAVRIRKPVGDTVGTAKDNLGNYPLEAVPAFPRDFILPAVPVPMYGVNVLPPNNATGGAVLGALPGALPPAQNNGFDNWFEIHQMASA